MQDLLKQQHQIAHDNAKQVFSSYVSWYTFFWTLNAGALGWLYSPQAMQVVIPQFVKGRLYLSILFAVLNVLGIGACLACWRANRQLRSDAIQAATDWLRLTGALAPPRTDTGLLPASLATYVFFTGAFTLLLNIAAWILLPIVAP